MSEAGKAGLGAGLVSAGRDMMNFSLEDAERKRRHAREDKLDRRDDEMHKRNTRLHEAQWAALQRAAKEEGTEELVRALESGVDPKAAMERYNSYGINKIADLQVGEDGSVHYRTTDGGEYKGSIKDMRKLVEAMKGPGPKGKGFSLSPGQAHYDENGNLVAERPAEAGGSNSKLPADAQMIEYLVANGIAKTKQEAFALTRFARTDPVDAVAQYVKSAQDTQSAQGLYPGSPGYKSPEQLQKEGVAWVRQIQTEYTDSFKPKGGGGGLDDLGAGTGLPGKLGKHADALSQAGPTRARAAAQPGASFDRTQTQRRVVEGSPYPEGTELVDRNTGKRYVVRNGQPVPVEGN